MTKSDATRVIGPVWRENLFLDLEDGVHWRAVLVVEDWILLGAVGFVAVVRDGRMAEIGGSNCLPGRLFVGYVPS